MRNFTVLWDRLVSISKYERLIFHISCSTLRRQVERSEAEDQNTKYERFLNLKLLTSRRPLLSPKNVRHQAYEQSGSETKHKSHNLISISRIRRNVDERLGLQGNHPRPNTDFSMKTIWAISTWPRMIFGHFKSGKKVF